MDIREVVYDIKVGWWIFGKVIFVTESQIEAKYSDMRL